MKLSEELKKRIKQLEQEQERQEQQLTDLNELRDLATITELENELKRIDENGLPAQPTTEAKNEGMDLSKEQEVAEQARRAQAEFRAQAQQQVHAAPQFEIAEEFLEELAPQQKVKIQGGYAVCLMFNPAAPSEWSEEGSGGWRGKSLGTHYLSLEEAKAKLQELQGKWPDYPLKVVKV